MSKIEFVGGSSENQFIACILGLWGYGLMVYSITSLTTQKLYLGAMNIEYSAIRSGVKRSSNGWGQSVAQIYCISTSRDRPLNKFSFTTHAHAHETKTAEIQIYLICFVAPRHHKFCVHFCWAIVACVDVIFQLVLLCFGVDKRRLMSACIRTAIKRFENCKEIGFYARCDDDFMTHDNTQFMVVVRSYLVISLEMMSSCNTFASPPSKRKSSRKKSKLLNVIENR